MMIDDERLAAEIENALGIINNAFQYAFDNSDTSELEDEIKRGIGEVMRCQDEVLDMFDDDGTTDDAENESA
jgi:hypothetical protein